VAVQRNLTAKASIIDIVAEVENDRRETVRKLAQAHDASARMVHLLLQGPAALKEVGQVDDQTASLKDEEGAIQYV
jgi:hypothetical protein